MTLHRQHPMERADCTKISRASFALGMAHANIQTRESTRRQGHHEAQCACNDATGRGQVRRTPTGIESRHKIGAPINVVVAPVSDRPVPRSQLVPHNIYTTTQANAYYDHVTMGRRRPAYRVLYLTFDSAVLQSLAVQEETSSAVMAVGHQLTMNYLSQ